MSVKRCETESGGGAVSGNGLRGVAGGSVSGDGVNGAKGVSGGRGEDPRPVGEGTGMSRDILAVFEVMLGM